MRVILSDTSAFLKGVHKFLGLGKKFFHSKEEEFHIYYTSFISSKELYLELKRGRHTTSEIASLFDFCSDF